MQNDQALLKRAYNLCARIQGNGRYGEPEEAEKVLRDSIAESPNSAELYYCLGLVQLENIDLDPEKAIASFRKAVELDPAHIKAQRIAAEILNSQDRFQEALPFATAALSLVEKKGDEQEIKSAKSLLDFTEKNIAAQTTAHPSCSAGHQPHADQS